MFSFLTPFIEELLRKTEMISICNELRGHKVRPIVLFKFDPLLLSSEQFEGVRVRRSERIITCI